MNDETNPEWKSSPYEAHGVCDAKQLGVIAADAAQRFYAFTLKVISGDPAFGCQYQLKEDAVHFSGTESPEIKTPLN